MERVAGGIRVYVLDDDEETCEVVGRALTRAGLEVTLAGAYDEALEQLVDETFDVLVLDVMLGERTGLELCAELRARGIDTPTLFLSARGTVGARIDGFDAGGDDYLPKPFAIKELVARVRALGRRGPTTRPGKLTLGAVVLDFDRRRALTEGRAIPLTAREWDILSVLANAGGRVVSFEALLERTWGETSERSRASLTVIMSRLRRKLEGACQKPVLRTLRGVGYALDVEP